MAPAPRRGSAPALAVRPARPAGGPPARAGACGSRRRSPGSSGRWLRFVRRSSEPSSLLDLDERPEITAKIEQPLEGVPAAACDQVLQLLQHGLLLGEGRLVRARRG